MAPPVPPVPQLERSSTRLLAHCDFSGHLPTWGNIHRGAWQDKFQPNPLPSCAPVPTGVNPPEMILLLLHTLIQWLLFLRLAACYPGCCLKTERKDVALQKVDTGEFASDEMTRTSVNWTFDAGSNWMRGRERWKANTVWSALLHDMLWMRDSELMKEEKMPVLSFKHIQQ